MIQKAYCICIVDETMNLFLSHMVQMKGLLDLELDICMLSYQSYIL
ncbi:MAG: hypothetical protein J6W16_03130 [Methanobrevibacter sp.]|nr:hypothetical protein [Methanobrevibacter sp.]